VDIMFLLERLESQIATGTGVPATHRVLVDRDAILDVIDQLRAAIPEEVRAAKRINAEGERILEKANEEASRIVSRAQEQAAFLIGERGLTEAALAQGRRIVADAEAAAEETRHGADVYARELMTALEDEVAKALTGVQKGIQVLDDRLADLHGPDGRDGVEDEPDEPADDEDAAPSRQRGDDAGRPSAVR
jgi:cell division septum initiation protein DivIVA